MKLLDKVFDENDYNEIFSELIIRIFLPVIDDISNEQLEDEHIDIHYDVYDLEVVKVNGLIEDEEINHYFNPKNYKMLDFNDRRFFETEEGAVDYMENLIEYKIKQALYARENITLH